MTTEDGIAVQASVDRVGSTTSPTVEQPFSIEVSPSHTAKTISEDWSKARAAFVFWIPVMLFCAGAGALYGAIAPGGRPLVGALYGLVGGGSVTAFERGLLFPRLSRALTRLPLAGYLLLGIVTYIGLILVASALMGSILLAFGILNGTLVGAMILDPSTLLYAVIMSATVVTLIRMRDLIGSDVFRNMLLGRYYCPVEEERIFLFLDLIGSTAYAQQHGDLRAQEFLGAIFAALAEPVRRHRGSIDDYVGDMAMVTWTMERGVIDARCIACVFTFLDCIARDEAMWRERFGQVPLFRAALHGGSVVTADVGVDRHKISYFGDVVNTTGRIEALSRSVGAPLLISSDLLSRLPSLPSGVSTRHMGDHALKGRGQPLTIHALERGGCNGMIAA
ncbi:adenylate/guanylate cyclase domain-containing protein [Lichenihabitans sp. PAMC28606]|uniref:adenylate/guanylate cyclase domain-containing protein n=1 Tax=Lichenihabitans sp. PAMC28606 TaxID=2880932 RepID=UPI001D0AACFC|nr:adenylate/guanylate cyclase domain-containing protein [Lichenihabitans sp. PAMC28606]UDL94660.1 adenylate/guanylate cyclase domain-containing protein [Lichenihabitans sp. PAMC28606]